MGLLDAIFSAGNSAKRKVKGLLSDPLNYLEEAANIWGDNFKQLASSPMENLGPGSIGKLMSPAIFIGSKAKTWDALQAAKAAELELSGVDPRQIWKDTGTWKGPDGKWRQEIPDNLAEWQPTPGLLTGNELALQHEVMPHARLSSAYPSLDEIVVKRQDSPGGSYSNAIINGNISHEDISIGNHAMKPAVFGFSVNPELGKSTNLHELQHAIQHREGFAKGGSPDYAPLLTKKARDDALAPLWMENNRYQELSEKAGELSRIAYLKKLEGLSTKQNIKPSEITNMSPWYEYSDDIRQWLGPMPKKSGSSRDGWLRDAAGLMLKRETEKTSIPSFQLSEYLSRDAKDIKNEYARLDRQRNKVLGGARQYSDLERKFAKISEMSPQDQYLRLAGEAEARATQARMNMDASQRRSVFPEDSYDVPMDQLIIRGLLSP